MKQLTLNKNSWHFLVATKMGGYNDRYDDSDICSYSRKIASGLLRLGFCGLLIAMIGFIMFHTLFGIWFSIMFGTFFFTSLGMVGVGFIVLAVQIVVVSKVLGYLQNRSTSTEYRNRPDGFIKHAYKSWKEKFCVQVEFK